MSDTREQRAARMADFPRTYVPFATHFTEDVRVCYGFVNAVCAGVGTLDKEIPAGDKRAWEAASEYLAARPF